MKLADPSNPRGGKSLSNLIDCAIGSCFYPPPGSEHYKLLWLDRFHGPSHTNNNQEKKSDNRMMKISNAHKEYYKNPRQLDVKPP